MSSGKPASTWLNCRRFDLRFTRRQLYTTLAVGAGAAYPVIVEPRWLEVSRRRVSMEGLRSPVRILHLSDLHASWVVPMSMIEHAVAVSVAEKPDIICVTGDFITRGSDFVLATYSAILRRLSAVAPTYAVLGNHDGGAWAGIYDGRTDHRQVDRLLEDSGIELLHNRSKVVTVRDSALTLVGTGDLWNLELDAPRAFEEVTFKTPVVLLNHNPDGKEVVAKYPWRLMLSGHTHGGQVVLPYFGPSYAPVVDKRYVEGLKPWGAHQIHVSRGVGNVMGIRFRCRPEVTLLELVGE